MRILEKNFLICVNIRNEHISRVRDTADGITKISDTADAYTIVSQTVLMRHLRWGSPASETTRPSAVSQIR
jgi:hypothetical protein